MTKVCVIHNHESIKTWIKNIATSHVEFVDIFENPDLVILPGEGNSDVHPKLYNQKVSSHVTTLDPKLDFEMLGYIQYCQWNDIPMFGICRGAQLLWVASGGNLIQHINPSHSTACSNEITLINGEKVVVNSYHHQAAELPTNPIEGVKAVLAQDGTAEIILDESYPYLGVQFHPEWPGNDPKINGEILLYLNDYLGVAL